MSGADQQPGFPPNITEELPADTVQSVLQQVELMLTRQAMSHLRVALAAETLAVLFGSSRIAVHRTV